MTPVITELQLSGVKKFKSGKVREVYDAGDAYVLVATDRISAFDCILPTGIPSKGAVLTQLSAWWFDRMKDLIPNHVLSTDTARYPAAFQPHAASLRGRSMLVRKAQAISVECVVRGYLIGSGWKDYQKTGAVCGIPLRAGYRMADRLEQPIFTPADKAESGHDENISFAQVAERLGKPLAEQLRDVSLEIYRRAAEYALTRGIIIADTKFEFGLLDGKLIWIDEALTPDSSRFWPVSDYRPGVSPPSFDKQFVRDYLETLDWDKTPPAPPLPDAVASRTAAKYREAYRLLTGSELCV